jgi:hypothetical protein
VVLFQLFQHVLQDLQVLFVSVRVDEQVINVDDYIPPATFDPFQMDLVKLQLEEPILQKAFFYDKHCRWPNQMSKTEETSLKDLLKRLITDKNGTIWVRLNDYKYPSYSSV